ncbi:response regulator transcription factor [Algoriphagus aquimarinus]|uniref:Phosphate regulon transcriptional regulatory protein PhoB n=1 Tax=Algoriphagus aquimarinus TaxID=237018 RepID=A0A1I0XLP2_9BACT|nr:response regulator transcription factor [Algoriphagus aquimarinus]SFB01892.1 DNA-binding response regulator, OmpR family, contains REC and winged-helix (wHTH) domain [Algoriphagus aquimarinus]|tara:strand:+ start:259453 stop:260151 length:699 start_codon:yes stop_codon:yes gene_type:complete
MKKVLIVEDDPNISQLIQIHLKDLDYEIKVRNNGREGFEEANTNAYDLIILDIMLPEMDGIAICQRLRALDNFTPILMITAKSEEIDKVIGLESGADDYITKPFKIREFIARVKAIMRRQDQFAMLAANDVKLIKFESLEIDEKKRKVILQQKRVDLTPKEFDLLVLMAKSPGRSYSRSELLELIWGYDFSGYEHTVNAHINRLRAKIEADPNNPIYILTTWGVGYRFNDEF